MCNHRVCIMKYVYTLTPASSTIKLKSIAKVDYVINVLTLPVLFCSLLLCLHFHHPLYGKCLLFLMDKIPSLFRLFLKTSLWLVENLGIAMFPIFLAISSMIMPSEQWFFCWLLTHCLQFNVHHPLSCKRPPLWWPKFLFF